MEEIKSNVILKFNDNQLLNVRKALGYEDVNKLKQDIEHLDDWIKKQSHFRVKEFDRGFLERCLIYNKGSIERTKQRLDKLFTCTNLMPDFLQNFDIKNEFVHMFNIANVCALPKPTKDNYRILLTRILGQDDKDFYLIHYYRYLLASPNYIRVVEKLDGLNIHVVIKSVFLGHYILNNDYCHGYEFLVDTRTVTLGNVRSMNPMVIQKGLTLMTEAMGHRLKKIHFISGSKFFDAVIALFKQGLSAKLKDRLNVHPNLESLHEQLPKELLPIELGGNNVSVKEINDENFKELCTDSNIEQVKYMEKATTDESLRLACKFNEEYSGMPGSFKTLCVD